MNEQAGETFDKGILLEKEAEFEKAKTIYDHPSSSYYSSAAPDSSNCFSVFNDRRVRFRMILPINGENMPAKNPMRMLMVSVTIVSLLLLLNSSKS